MTMAAWITKLDEFLRLADRGVLTGAGQISHAAAMAKVDAEFEAWDMRLADPTCAELRSRADDGGGTYLACYDARSGKKVEERAESGF